LQDIDGYYDRKSLRSPNVALSGPPRKGGGAPTVPFWTERHKEMLAGASGGINGASRFAPGFKGQKAVGERGVAASCRR